MESELDRNLEQVQATLLDRFAPSTRILRLRWSAGETQAYELGAGPPLLYVHGGLGGSVRDRSRPFGARAGPARDRGQSTRARPRRSVRLPRGRPARPRSDVHRRHPGCARAPDRRRGRQLDGRPLVVAFAIDAPSRVSRLVLVGAPAGCRRQVPIQLIPFGLPLVGAKLGEYVFSNATPAGSRRFWRQLLVTRPENVDDLLFDIDAANCRRNVETMVSLVKRVADVRRFGLHRELMLAERWRSLTTPTLFLWGEDDAFAPPSDVEAFVAESPSLHLVRLADAGHLRGSTSRSSSSRRSSASWRRIGARRMMDCSWCVGRAPDGSEPDPERPVDGGAALVVTSTRALTVPRSVPLRRNCRTPVVRGRRLRGSAVSRARRRPALRKETTDRLRENDSVTLPRFATRSSSVRTRPPATRTRRSSSRRRSDAGDAHRDDDTDAHPNCDTSSHAAPR